MNDSDRSDAKIIIAVLLIGFGVGFQFLGGWGIDFAFIDTMGGNECTHLPIVNHCMDVGSWWNLNFFVFFPLGAIMMVSGSYGLGRELSKIKRAQ